MNPRPCLARLAAAEKRARLTFQGSGKGKATGMAEALTYRVYEDALLAPDANRTVYRDIYAGAFDEDGAPIEESLLFRSWNPPQIAFPPELSPAAFDEAERLSGTYLYGGYFFGHFGHFLLESLARAWALEETGPLPFAWVTGGQPNVWQSELLAMTGCRGPHLFPDRPVRVERLIVPQPGYVIQKFFAERHARFLEKGGVTARRDANGEKIWLSRRGVDLESRRSRAEGRLEAVLEERGWRIFSPESVSVAEQLETVSRAAVLGGLQGSAFHLGVLMRGDIPPFVMLRRTVTRNFRTVADRKGIAEFDLYGAFATRRKNDFRLAAPERWARIVDAAGREAAAARGEALHRAEAAWNARFSPAAWDRRLRRDPAAWLAWSTGAGADAAKGLLGRAGAAKAATDRRRRLHGDRQGGAGPRLATFRPQNDTLT